MSHECCSVSEVEVILEVEILLYFLFVAVEGTVVVVVVHVLFKIEEIEVF